MKIKYFEFKNVASYGNKVQRIDFVDNGLLWIVLGVNGAGKCFSPDTEIEIDIEDKEIYNMFLKRISDPINT